MTASPGSDDPETGNLTARINVHLDDDTRTVLEAIRKERGPATTLADIVRDALRKYATEQRRG